jgi:hypothetical protein
MDIFINIFNNLSFNTQPETKSEFVNTITLVPQLIEKICMFLPYKTVIAFSLCSKYINTYVKDENVVYKRKYLGYPRISGRCKTHNISQYKDEIKFEFLFKPQKIQNFKRKSTTDLLLEITGFKQPINRKSLLDQLLDFLGTKDVDLIRGDVLCYDHYAKFIFDGRKIIDINYSAKIYGHIPTKFTVISNNVPARYWSDVYINKKFIADNIQDTTSFVWFIVNDNVKQQLLQNIKDDGKNKFEKIGAQYYTYFTINDTQYYIICFLTTLDEFVCVFNNLLASNKSDRTNKLLLQYALHGDENILLLSSEYNCDEDKLPYNKYLLCED